MRKNQKIENWKTSLVLLIILLFTPTCIPPGEYSYRRNPDEKRLRLKQQASTMLGIPYRYGGVDRSGMDCSGLVVRLFRDVSGLRLPHSTRSLYRKGKPVSGRALETGDLIFFRNPGDVRPNHVGVFLENGEFIHASSSRGVIISSLNTGYYKKRFIGARRIL